MLRLGLLAALLVLAPLAGAVDPHPRASPAMTLDSAVTAMAMATSAGTIVAGRVDPTTTSGETPHVWRAWDADGGLRRSETADKTNCSNNLLIDPCLGSVVDVAISADGARIVIAARDDQDVGRLVFATLSGGIVTRLELTDELPTGVAISPDGSRVAVSSEIPGGTGRVRLYGWSTTTASGVVTSTWSAATALPATAVALGPEGRVSAAAGDRHYRFVTTGTAVASYMHDNDVTLHSVAYAAASAAQWSVAGASDGGILLYSSSEETTNPSPREDLQPGTSAQNVVAITTDGRLYAAGDGAGVVRLIRNIHLVTGVPVVATTAPLPGAVSDLLFSTDARYLVAGAGAATVLYRVTDTSLTEVWRHVGNANVVDVGINADGTLVSSAAGSAVTMFTTVRSAVLTATGNGTIVPSQAAQATLTVRNTGNREDTITLDAPVAPAGWTATLSRSTFSLAPDATATTLLNVTAPATAAPGVAKISITQRQTGVTPSVTTEIGFTVAQRHVWTLEADGAVSRDIDVGQSVKFPFKATNLGNAVDTTTASVDVDRTGWTASVTSPLTAAPGQTVTGEVTLTAPATASELESAAVTVRLGADQDASLRFTAAIGARFGLDLAVTPDDSNGTPGQPVSFVVRVTNTGNVPDTYVLTPSGLQSGWVLTMAPTGKTPVVAPGASTDVTVQLTPVATADGGTYAVRFQAASQGDPTQSKEGEYLLRIPEEVSGSPTKGSKGSPGLEVGLAVLALAALAFVRRRD